MENLDFKKIRFKLNSIKPLYYDMKSNNAKQDKFRFVLNEIYFDVIFLIDRNPYELLFGIIDHNYSFSLKLYNGFLLEFIPNDVFYKLCDILNLKSGKESFTTFKFLEHFSKHIPELYSGYKVEPNEIAYYKKDNIEECTKIYFKGWRTHVTDDKNVTESNLEKTKKLLGDSAYEFCKKNNISSCWSDIIDDRKAYYPPNEFLFKNH